MTPPRRIRPVRDRATFPCLALALTCWGLAAVGSPARAEGDDAIPFHGRVLDPDGKPFAGAKLYVAWGSSQARLPTVPARGISDAEGQFRFAIPRAEFAALREDDPWMDEEPWREAEVVALAEGFGAGIAMKADRDGERTLRLAKDDVPIRGRIIDGSGKPVAGTRAQVTAILASEAGLTPYIESFAGRGEADWDRNDYFSGWLQVSLIEGLFPAATTDADGRFTLRGVGRERLAMITVSGPTMATDLLSVLTRAMEPLRLPEFTPGPFGSLYVEYGATFAYEAGPMREAVGTVRELETGKPIGGVAVGDLGLATTITDDSGRFRLTGLPSGDKPDIKAWPRGNSGYLPIEKKNVGAAGTGPIEVDFRLPRGVVVSGRVIDPATGKPVPGGITYEPLAGNRPLRDAFVAEGATVGWHGARVGRDGNFRIVVPTGPGVLLLEAGEIDKRGFFDWRHYLRARRDPGDGAPTFKDQADRLASPYQRGISLEHHHAYRVIDPVAGRALTGCDLRVNTGLRKAGTILGPDGQPLAGARVSGLTREERLDTLEGAEFEAITLDPESPRRLLAWHEGRKLAGYKVIVGDEIGPVFIQLEPWGAVAGRALDPDKTPLAEVQVEFNGYEWEAGQDGHSPETWPHHAPIVTDRDGKFRLDGLVPGLTPGFGYRNAGEDFFLNARKGESRTVRPGETVELGNLKGSPFPFELFDPNDNLPP